MRKSEAGWGGGIFFHDKKCPLPTYDGTTRRGPGVQPGGGLDLAAMRMPCSWVSLTKEGPW